MGQVNLLMKAREEIVALRRENQLLGAQVGVINVFAAALGLNKGPQGACIDVAWELQREIDRLSKPLDDARENDV